MHAYEVPVLERRTDIRLVVLDAVLHVIARDKPRMQRAAVQRAKVEFADDRRLVDGVSRGTMRLGKVLVAVEADDVAILRRGTKRGWIAVVEPAAKVETPGRNLLDGMLDRREIAFGNIGC